MSPGPWPHAARRVRVIDLDDGMARLVADLPAVLAYAILDRLTEISRTLDHTTPDVDDSTGARDGDSDTDDGSDTDAADAARSQIGPGAGDDGRAPAGPSGRATLTTGPTPTTSATPSDTSAGDGHCGVEDEGGPEDTRTVDQRRADILADLLLAAAPAAHGGDALGSVTGHVQVTVPVLTLAGRSREPALLAGYGPIDPDTARRLTGGSPGFDRVMTHPYTGAVLAVDRYKPNADLHRYLTARDERCRAPGCTRRAQRCDIDHTLDYAKGGTTSHGNLSHFCRRHHTIKGNTAWTVRQRPGGIIEWTCRASDYVAGVVSC